MSHNITTLDLSITSNTTLVACDDDRLKDVLLPSSLSSSPVSISTMPNDITTTLDLSHFSNCKRLSVASDTTLVACDDDYSKDVLLPSSLSSSPVFKSTMSHNITTLDLSIISDTALVACDDDRLKDVLLLFLLLSPSPVFRPTPNDITTTLDLSHFSNCKRLSIASDATLVACDDDSNDIFSDKVNYAMSQPGVQAPAHTTDNVRIDVLAPSTTIDIISPFCMPYVRPLVLVDKCQTTPTCTASRSVPGSVHLTDALLQTTNSFRSSPSVVPKDDFVHVEGVFTGTDEASDTKDIEHHIDTLPPCMPALITNNGFVGTGTDC
ncbi:hypothetical protein EV424DRAFT_1378598 [Suillus variegatus]|nr:hypothetical protein EV424DRAFT_1378598 [Suillus variegatus]